MESEKIEASFRSTSCLGRRLYLGRVYDYEVYSSLLVIANNVFFFAFISYRV